MRFGPSILAFALGLTTSFAVAVSRAASPTNTPTSMEPLITQSGEDEATASARNFLKLHAQEIIDKSPPSEDDIDSLATALLMTGDLDNAWKVLTKGVQLYPNSQELVKTMKLAKAMVEANKNLMDVDAQLVKLQKELAGTGEDYSSSVALTRRLVQSLSQILTGKVQVMMKYTEQGEQKSGRLMVGRAAVKEWVKTLNTMGAAVYSDTNELADILSKLTAIEPVEKWPDNMEQITTGDLKGAYTKTGKVATRHGRDMYITVFPALGFFEAAFK